MISLCSLQEKISCTRSTLRLFAKPAKFFWEYDFFVLIARKNKLPAKHTKVVREARKVFFGIISLCSLQEKISCTRSTLRLFAKPAKFFWEYDFFVLIARKNKLPAKHTKVVREARKVFFGIISLCSLREKICFTQSTLRLFAKPVKFLLVSFLCALCEKK